MRQFVDEVLLFPHRFRRPLEVRADVDVRPVRVVEARPLAQTASFGLVFDGQVVVEFPANRAEVDGHRRRILVHSATLTGRRLVEHGLLGGAHPRPAPREHRRSPLDLGDADRDQRADLADHLCPVTRRDVLECDVLDRGAQDAEGVLVVLAGRGHREGRRSGLPYFWRYRPSMAWIPAVSPVSGPRRRGRSGSWSVAEAGHHQVELVLDPGARPWFRTSGPR